MMHQELAILMIDDHCIICNKFVQFIFKIDTKEQIHFASLTTAQKAQNTLIFNIDGIAYQRSDAVVKLFKEIGGFWKILGFCLSIFPKFFRDSCYNLIASNRYRFGKQKCSLPPTELKLRILD